MTAILREKTLARERVFQLVEGDITRQTVDAVVNAANAQLQHGGGVARVIARAGGPVIQQESRGWVEEHGPISHQQPAFTSAGDLPASYVIHAAGPVWGSGDEDQKLKTTVTSALELADELGVKSLALPAISTGIYGFPKIRAARVMFEAVENYLRREDGTGLQEVRLVLYGEEAVKAFTSVWDQG